MIGFDKLKIVVKSADYITNLNMNKFHEVREKGEISCYIYKSTAKYKPKQPALLVKKDISCNQSVIEITGKILHERYPELINKTNIRQCLENIISSGLCNLDIDAILKEGEVWKADVTKDIEFDKPIKELSKELKVCIKNHDTYTAEIVKGNFILTKKSTKHSRTKRLSVYDKDAEMRKADNKRWVNSLGSEATRYINEYFHKKIRFEMNLNSAQIVRDELKIAEASIESVLNSDTNPILDFLDKALVMDVEARVAKSLYDYARLALMKEHNYDMKAIQSVVQLYKANGSDLSEMMKPYRELYKGMFPSPPISLKEMLKGMLAEIFIIGFVLL